MSAHDQASEWIHKLVSRGCTLSQDEMRAMFIKGLTACHESVGLTSGEKTTLHLLCWIPPLEGNTRTIRIVIPGIDNGSAVWFEAKVERDTQEAALDLMRACLPHLRNVVIEICPDCSPAMAQWWSKNIEPRNRKETHDPA